MHGQRDSSRLAQKQAFSCGRRKSLCVRQTVIRSALSPCQWRFCHRWWRQESMAGRERPSRGYCKKPKQWLSLSLCVVQHPCVTCAYWILNVAENVPVWRVFQATTYNNKGCFYEVKADVVEKKQRLGTNENFHFSYSNNTGTLHWKKKKKPVILWMHEFEYWIHWIVDTEYAEYTDYWILNTVDREYIEYWIHWILNILNTEYTDYLILNTEYSIHWIPNTDCIEYGRLNTQNLHYWISNTLNTKYWIRNTEYRILNTVTTDYWIHCIHILLTTQHWIHCILTTELTEYTEC